VRRLKILILLFVALLSAALVALYLQKEKALEAALFWVAQEEGLPLKAASVVMVSDQQAIVGPIETTDGSLSVSSVVVTYSLGQLLYGQLDQLTIKGLNLSVKTTGNEIEFPFLEDLKPSSEGSKPFQPTDTPVKNVSIEGLISATGERPFAVEFTLLGSKDNEGLSVSYKASEPKLGVRIAGDALVIDDQLTSTSYINFDNLDLSNLASQLKKPAYLNGQIELRSEGAFSGLVGENPMISQKIEFGSSQLLLDQIEFDELLVRQMDFSSNGVFETGKIKGEFKGKGSISGGFGKFEFEDAAFSFETDENALPARVSSRLFPFVLTAARSGGDALQVEGVFPSMNTSFEVSGGGAGIKALGVLENGSLRSSMIPADLMLGREEFEAKIKDSFPFVTFAVSDLKVLWKDDFPIQVPIVVNAKGKLQKDELVVDASTSSKGFVKIKAQASHQLSSGNGQIAFSLGPLEFDPNGLQPGQIVEELKQQISSVGGKVTAKGMINWGKSNRSWMDLGVEDGGFHTAIAKFAGVNLSLELDNLFPPSTPKRQTLTAALVDVGVPFTNVASEFHISRDGKIVIEELTWPFAGGVFSVGGATFDLARSAHKIGVSVSGIELRELAETINLDGLGGTGLLSGVFPIAVEGGALLVRDAHLVSDGKGILRYDAPSTGDALKAAGDNANLLVQALKNFHYDNLALKLNGDLAREVEVRVELAGRNPNLYDGYPLQLNFSISGALGDMIRKGMIGMEIPESLKRKLQTRH